MRDWQLLQRGTSVRLHSRLTVVHCVVHYTCCYPIAHNMIARAHTLHKHNVVQSDNLPKNSAKRCEIRSMQQQFAAETIITHNSITITILTEQIH